MKYRKRIYYTDSDKELMRDRYCEGDSLHAIARLFDRSHGSIAGIRSIASEIGRSARRPVNWPTTARWHAS